MTRCERCSAVIYETSLRCRRCRGVNDHAAVRSWEEVAEAMVAMGERVTRQAITQAAERALFKLKAALLADPLIREWIEEQGLASDARCWDPDSLPGRRRKRKRRSPDTKERRQ